DLHAAPIIAYFLKVEEGQKLFARFPDLNDWWDRIAKRASFSNG
ncbi:MAG: glutathione S-transferase family protein, partial [Mesorhizobium sp.]